MNSNPLGESDGIRIKLYSEWICLDPKNSAGKPQEMTEIALVMNERDLFSNREVWLALLVCKQF